MFFQTNDSQQLNNNMALSKDQDNLTNQQNNDINSNFFFESENYQTENQDNQLNNIDFLNNKINELQVQFSQLLSQSQIFIQSNIQQQDSIMHDKNFKQNFSTEFKYLIVNFQALKDDVNLYRQQVDKKSNKSKNSQDQINIQNGQIKNFYQNDSDFNIKFSDNEESSSIYNFNNNDFLNNINKNNCINKLLIIDKFKSIDNLNNVNFFEDIQENNEKNNKNIKVDNSENTLNNEKIDNINNDKIIEKKNDKQNQDIEQEYQKIKKVKKETDSVFKIILKRHDLNDFQII